MGSSKYHEYDVVELCKPLQNIKLPLGTRGAVLIVHISDPPEYEVEFTNTDGDTLALITISEEYLKKVEMDQQGEMT